MAKTYYMTRILLLAILAVIGCGSSGTSDNGAVSATTGLRYSVDTRGSLPGSLALLDSLYTRVEQCVGVSAPGPQIIFVSESSSSVYPSGGSIDSNGVIYDAKDIMLAGLFVQYIFWYNRTSYTSVQWQCSALTLSGY